MWDSNVNDTGPVYGDNVSPGPKLGFLGALESAYNDQVRNASINGLAYSFMRADEEEEQRAKKNGKEYSAFYKRESTPHGERTIPGITDPLQPTLNAYYKMARTIVDNEDNDTLGDFAMHDAKTIEQNTQGGHQIRTLSEIYEGVKKQAKQTEQQANLDWTIPGYAGGLIGAVAGSLDPRTDPLNTATLAVGGFGKSAALRIASQAGGQAITEGINQLTGVQENRRLLGLDYGVSDAAMRIGGAAAGGALVQGGAEVLTAGVRRAVTGKWFADTPMDRAPPAPAEPAVEPIAAPPRAAPATGEVPGPSRSPLWDSPIGRPRAEADLTVVHAELSSWGGKRPWEIGAPTAETRIPGAEPKNDFHWDVAPGPETLDSIARRVDPEVFAVYDKYAAQKVRAREEIAALGAERNSKAGEAVASIQDQIDDLRQKTDGATRRLGKKYEARIAELEKQRDQYLAIETRGDTPEMAVKRQELMEADYQMRDMAPAVTRAYASAQNKWTVYEEQRKAIAQMIRDGAPGIGEKQIVNLADEPPSLAFRSNDPVAIRETVIPKAGERISEAMARHADEVQKIADETLDTFASFAKQATKDVAEDAEAETHITLNIHGKEVKMALDEGVIAIPGDDGGIRKVTPRQLLKEVDNDNEMLKAVSSCSINATS
jgi:hypothetical protein